MEISHLTSKWNIVWSSNFVTVMIKISSFLLILYSKFWWGKVEWCCWWPHILKSLWYALFSDAIICPKHCTLCAWQCYQVYLIQKVMPAVYISLKTSYQSFSVCNLFLFSDAIIYPKRCTLCAWQCYQVYICTSFRRWCQLCTHHWRLVINHFAN